MGPGYRRPLLFGLQALALLLLILSLLAPEIRRGRIEFHNPCILILRDQSTSFQNGRYLGLGTRYSQFEKFLSERYSSRGFEIRSADFNESTWPVAGFQNQAQFTSRNLEDPSTIKLTSLTSAADYVDSAAIPNLQAIFLFSDGRSNLDSEKSMHFSAAPMFPVVMQPDSIQEVQLEKVVIEPNQNSKALDFRVTYQSLGQNLLEPSFRLIQNGKTLLQRNIPNQPSLNTYRFTGLQTSPQLAASGPITAVLQPNSRPMNFDVYNDSLNVDLSALINKRKIYVLRPVRSLDERAMLDILSGPQSEQVIFFDQNNFSRLSLTTKDQVWIEAGALSQSSQVLDLQNSKAKLVFYLKAGFEAGKGRAAFLKGRINSFLPQSAITPTRSAAEIFPDGVVRLGALTQVGLDALEPREDLTTLVEIADGTQRGVLIGRGLVQGEKRGLFFSLPQIWNQLFDPQADFAMRTHIGDFIGAVKHLADREGDEVRVSYPQRLFHGVPFDLGFTLPESNLSLGKKNKPEIGAWRLTISGTGFNQDYAPSATVNSERLEWNQLMLYQGRYQFNLSQGESILWKDSIWVHEKAELELSKIGFDASGLAELSEHTGGRLLAPTLLATGQLDTLQVSSMLPSLPAAQIRTEIIQAIRLYNTLTVFILIFLLLASSWLFRKKWDLD